MADINNEAVMAQAVGVDPYAGQPPMPQEVGVDPSAVPMQQGMADDETMPMVAIPMDGGAVGGYLATDDQEKDFVENVVSQIEDMGERGKVTTLFDTLRNMEDRSEEVLVEKPANILEKKLIELLDRV